MKAAPLSMRFNTSGFRQENYKVRGSIAYYVIAKNAAFHSGEDADSKRKTSISNEKRDHVGMYRSKYVISQEEWLSSEPSRAMVEREFEADSI